MYKNGQGMMSRIGIFVLCVLLGFYSGYMFKDAFGGSLNSIFRTTWFAPFSQVFLTLVFVGLGGWISFVLPRTADFLIDMDVELRKVIWPETQPLFSKKAEAWGATYVVIITVIVMTLFIYVVDLGWQWVVQEGLFGKLYHL